MEFTREQIKEFNKKGYTSVAARMCRDAEKYLEQLEATNGSKPLDLNWIENELEHLINESTLLDIDLEAPEKVEKIKVGIMKRLADV